MYIYPPARFGNNPNNKYNPKYTSLTIFNLSKVDHLYIGRDTVIAFADVPKFETYNVEIASEDKRIPDKTKKLGAPEAQN